MLSKHLLSPKKQNAPVRRRRGATPSQTGRVSDDAPESSSPAAHLRMSGAADGAGAGVNAGPGAGDTGAASAANDAAALTAGKSAALVAQCTNWTVRWQRCWAGKHSPIAPSTRALARSRSARHGGEAAVCPVACIISRRRLFVFLFFLARCCTRVPYHW